MSEPLVVNLDGMRLAAALGEGLAADVAISSLVGGVGSSTPTMVAVKSLTALMESARADQAAYLSGRANALRSAASQYEGADDASAGAITGTT